VRKHNRIAKQEVRKNSFPNAEAKIEGALHKNGKIDEKIWNPQFQFLFQIWKD